MSSLNRHLVCGAGHGGLAYHPECPVCRERCFGGPLPDSVLGARGRAVLLGVTTAAAVAFPSAASADEEYTGPAGAFTQGELQQIGQTPGGDLAPTPEGPEPPDEPGDPVVETGDPVVETGDPPGEAVTTAPAAPPAGAQVAPAPPPAADQPPAPQAAEPSAEPESESRRDESRRDSERVAAARSERAPVVTRAPAPAPPVRSEPAPAPARTAAPAVVATPEPVPAGTDGVHVVVSGESLWSIAAKSLGSGASAAEIAREVNRIWKLNASSIRSGQPDLIMAGERLRLS